MFAFIDGPWQELSRLLRNSALSKLTVKNKQMQKLQQMQGIKGEDRVKEALAESGASLGS